jgi:cell division septation protein DedD
MAQEQPPQPTKKQILERIAEMERQNQEYMRALEAELGPTGGPSVIPPKPTPKASPESAPRTPEEAEVQKEIENMSEEDRERLGWGLSVIGYRVEKMKDDLLAGALAGWAKKADKKGTLGRFVNELRNTFVRDAEDAQKKGMAIQKGEDKSKWRQAKNIGLLSGNVLKYGRFVYDTASLFRGLNIANPFRYVMITGQLAARGAEAGKEARFKSDKLLEKTQIEDAEKAAEEAWRIYEGAGGGASAGPEGGGRGASAEALKDAYLREMPEDIQKRLENPTTALNFIQHITRGEILIRLERLQKKIDKTSTGTEKQKLLESWKKELMDYDRMITQYGTVDQLAMLGRNVQLTAKGFVLGMQLQTGYKLLTNVPRLWEHLSHILSHHGTHEAIVSTGGAKVLPHETPIKTPASAHTPETTTTPTTTPEPSATPEHTPPPTETPAAAPETTPTPTHTPIPIHTPTPEHIETPAPSIPEAPSNPLEAKVDLSSRGFTQTIFDLKHKLIEQYGTPDKMPANVKTFYETPSTKLSQEYGFWDTEKGTSGMGYHGEKLSLDADGHLKLEHLGGNSETIDTEHKFGGKMFTPEKTAPAPKVPETSVHETAPAPAAPAVEHVTPPTTPTEKDWQKFHGDHTLSHVSSESDADKISKLHTTIYQAYPDPGNNPRIPEQSGNAAYYAPYNQPQFNQYGMPMGGMHGAEHFIGLTPEQDNFLHHHMDFVDKNPFHLTGKQLLGLYKLNDSNLHKVFSHNEYGMELWNNLKDAKVGELIKTKNPDPNDRLLAYIQGLHKITKLSPKGMIIGKPETTEHYIARALQWAAKHNKLNLIKVE